MAKRFILIGQEEYKKLICGDNQKSCAEKIQKEDKDQVESLNQTPQLPSEPPGPEVDENNNSPAKKQKKKAVKLDEKSNGLRSGKVWKRWN